MSAPRRLTALLVAVSVVLGAAVTVGCSPGIDGGADEPTTSSSAAPEGGPTTTSAPLLGAPAPTFEALSDAFTYGDDPGLDALWDACAAGEGKACDDLYHAAPIDSEYENFGYTCGDRPNVIICTELDEEPGLTPPTTR
jgi:hypothetical protein